MSIKPFLIAFPFFAIFASIVLLGAKPYLKDAVLHGRAGIYDYTIFANRVIPASEAPRALPRHEKSLQPPPAEVQNLLEDLQTTALLVLENGKIVFEKYSSDGGVNVKSGSFSMAKSFVSLMVGALWDRGMIKDLDQPLSIAFPEWQGRREGEVSFRNLLQMTDGLLWNESYWNPFSITVEAYYGDDLLKTALKQRVIEKQGTRFSYESGSTLLLGIAISRLTRRTLSEFFYESLWNPVGAEAETYWSLDKDRGVEKSYCCLNATARDFAKIGQLVLNRGRVDQKQVISEAYLTAMTKPHQVKNSSDEPTDYYGYQWWIYPTEKEAVYYARGILGQFILIYPKENRVVVRLGHRTGDRVQHQPEEVIALSRWIQNASLVLEP